MTKTQLPRTFDYTIPAEYYGDFSADYDTAAIDAEVRDAINAKLPDGISLAGNGMIFADVDLYDQACEIDFAEMLAAVDLEAIIAKHETKAE